MAQRRLALVLEMGFDESCLLYMALENGCNRMLCTFGMRATNLYVLERGVECPAQCGSDGKNVTPAEPESWDCAKTLCGMYVCLNGPARENLPAPRSGRGISAVDFVPMICIFDLRIRGEAQSTPTPSRRARNNLSLFNS